MNRFATIKRTFGILALLIAMVISVSACNDFLDVNKDPNNASPSDIEGEPGLPFLTAVTQFSTNKTIEIIEESSFAQLWSAATASVFTNPELYSISTFTTGNTWSAVYTTVGQNLQFIIDATESADPPRPNAAAQAKILQAYAYFYATQLFGDVPFTEANNSDEFPNPHVDSQEDVLRGVIAQIDEALNQIDPEAPAGITDRDVFYNGNMDQWRRFGNSVKLKAYMLLRSGGADVDSDIQALLSQPLIHSNADNAMFPYGSQEGNENSSFQLLADFSGGVNFWLDCAKPMVDIMNDLNDPRLSTYCDPLPSGEFVGLPMGDFVFDPGGTQFSSVSLNIMRPEFPERYATAAETLLLEAEWYAKQGDLATADAKFRQGIAASIDFFDEKPGAIQEADKEAYINSFPDLSTMSQEEAIRTIQVQEWIDLFERRPEAWTHWRRTKVPELTAPPNAQLGTIIRRYPYPPDPQSSNPNIPSPKSNDTPMWFEGGS